MGASSGGTQAGMQNPPWAGVHGGAGQSGGPPQMMQPHGFMQGQHPQMQGGIPGMLMGLGGAMSGPISMWAKALGLPASPQLMQAYGQLQGRMGQPGMGMPMGGQSATRPPQAFDLMAQPMQRPVLKAGGLMPPSVLKVGG